MPYQKGHVAIFPILPSSAPWAVLEPDFEKWDYVRLNRGFPSRLGLDLFPRPILELGARDPLFMDLAFLCLISNHGP